MLTFSLMLAGWCAADLAWWRLAWRGLRRLRRPRWPRAAVAAFAVTQAGYLALTFASALIRGVPDIPPLHLHVAAYLWHFVVLPASLAAYVLAAGATYARRLARRVGRRSSATFGPPAEVAGRATSTPDGVPRPSRRELLAGTVALTPPLATLTTTAIARRRLDAFQVNRVALDVPGLPAALDGLTVAHLTDVHIGRFLPAGMLERVADAVNALDADLIAFTGDLNDLSAPDVRPGIDFVRRLRARHGVALVEGNHDVMADADKFEKACRDAGLPLLLDEAVTFTPRGPSVPVQFAGITWGTLKRGREIGRTDEDAETLFRVYSEEATADAVARVAALRVAGTYPILLAHHPHAFEPAAAAGFPLVLAGHTHGGQIMLTPSLGAGPARFRYWTGVYRRAQSSLHVANGVGNWFPLRWNAPQEVVLLTLRRPGHLHGA